MIKKEMRDQASQYEFHELSFYTLAHLKVVRNKKNLQHINMPGWRGYFSCKH